MKKITRAEVSDDGASVKFFDADGGLVWSGPLYTPTLNIAHVRSYDIVPMELDPDFVYFKGTAARAIAGDAEAARRLPAAAATFLAEARAGDLPTATIGRCATCRWAEVRPPVRSTDPATIRQDEASRAARPFLCGRLQHDQALLSLEYDADDETGRCDVSHVLAVAPEFGCVQWEAKE